MKIISHTFFGNLLLVSIVCLVGCGQNNTETKPDTPTSTTPSLKICQTCNGVGRQGECLCVRQARMYNNMGGNVRDGFRLVERNGRREWIPCDLCQGTLTNFCGDCNGRGTLPR